MFQSIFTSLPITGDNIDQVGEQQPQDKAMNILDNKTIILATLLGWLLLIDEAIYREEFGEKNSVLWYETI